MLGIDGNVPREEGRKEIEVPCDPVLSVIKLIVSLNRVNMDNFKSFMHAIKDTIEEIGKLEKRIHELEIIVIANKQKE